MRSTKTLLAVAVICLALGATAISSPQLIDYQGFLKTSGGSPVTSTLSMTFTIYTAVTGGTSKWTETQGSVVVTGGLFNVTLGSSTAIPDSVFNGDDRYLEISIGGTALSPRTRIVSSAYGQRVETVDGATGGTLTGSVSAGKGNFGTSNTNTGTDAFVVGSNCVSAGDYSTVAGGRYNEANGAYSTVAGGGWSSSVYKNVVDGDGGAIGGGIHNSVDSSFAVVSGGNNNRAVGKESSIGGGYGNLTMRQFAVVAGGYANIADSQSAAVGGGHGNVAVGRWATVTGGMSNIASNEAACVAGGQSDTASGIASIAAGGAYNAATGFCSITAGGLFNRAAGFGSFACGHNANANHTSTFVWSDSGGSPFASSAPNQISLRSRGGVRIYTNSGLTAGVTLAAGGSQWQSVSDSTRKRNIRIVDTRDVLQKLMQLPVSRWSYKAQDASIEHIGPMAQDFYRLFGIGEDDKTISMMDPAGIALAAIQELYKMQKQLEAKTNELAGLQTELAQLRAMVIELAASTTPANDNTIHGSVIEADQQFTAQSGAK